MHMYIVIYLFSHFILVIIYFFIYYFMLYIYIFLLILGLTDTYMQKLLLHTTHQFIMHYNSNTFLPLYIKAAAHHAITGRTLFSIGHGKKAGIIMPGQISPTL
jgi:hypothetical protein